FASYDLSNPSVITNSQFLVFQAAGTLNGVTLDGNGNAYTVGQVATSPTNNDLLLAKFDPTGMPLYAFTLQFVAGDSYGAAVAVDSNISGDPFYIGGQLSTTPGTENNALFLSITVDPTGMTANVNWALAWNNVVPGLSAEVSGLSLRTGEAGGPRLY